MEFCHTYREILKSGHTMCTWRLVYSGDPLKHGIRNNGISESWILHILSIFICCIAFIHCVLCSDPAEHDGT